MDEYRESMMKEIMSIDFTIVELNLYLNTHPFDQRALYLYNCAVQRSQMLRKQYEARYGPLTASSSFSKYPWQWVKSPWPWEGR